MPFVFKLSRIGKDISSDDPRDFVFSSLFGSVKIVQEPPNKTPVSVEVAGSSNATLTVAHNLGFIPLCLIFAERTPNSGRYHFGTCYQSVDDLTTPVTVVGLVANTYVDATNLVIKFYNNNASAQTVKVYYFILGDSAS